MRWPWMTKKRHEKEMEVLAFRLREAIEDARKLHRKDQEAFHRVVTTLSQVSTALEEYNLPRLHRIETDAEFLDATQRHIRKTEDFVRTHERLPIGYERLWLMGVECRAHGDSLGSIILTPETQ